MRCQRIGRMFRTVPIERKRSTYVETIATTLQRRSANRRDEGADPSWMREHSVHDGTVIC